MTERERQILAIVRRDPLITQRILAEQLGISRSAVAGHIMKLVDKGAIKGKGYIFGQESFICVIGGANMDIHGIPSSDLRMHDSNPGNVHISPGGVARNIAENLALWGNDSRLITAIGTDDHGQMLLQRCLSSGIDMQSVLQIDAGETSSYLSILDSEGQLVVAVSDMKMLEQLGPDHLKARSALLKSSELVIVDTNLSEGALAYVMSAHAHQPIFVDTVSSYKARKILPYLGAVHTLKPGLAEATELANMKVKDESQLPELAAWFHGKGVDRVFISLGQDGVFYSTRRAQGIERALPAGNGPTYTNGAGDAFLAGLGHAWIKKWSLQKSVRFALSAAALTVSHPQTICPNMTEASVYNSYEENYE